MTIGYVALDPDPRYRQERSYAGIRIHPGGRPVDGARTAIRESRALGRALGVEFQLVEATGTDTGAVIAAIEALHGEHGAGFILLDAPADVLVAAADALRDGELLLFNVSAPDDALRADQCRANLVHTVPSHAMLTDALAQYLVSRNWRQVLMLVGPLAEDERYADAFARSARRFGLNLVDRRAFEFGNDPRRRDSNNVALLTARGDYDIVLLAETDGEFGRYVPYQTNRPRPVVGTEGLVAEAWHWAWERHGAPQLNQRFERQAERPMRGVDWAAWVAVRSVIESVAQTRSTAYTEVAAFLRSERLTLDGYKGNPVRFRPWDNQLRQPILLGTGRAVIERAPLAGFLHPTEYMDTLGYDEGDRLCRFPDGANAVAGDRS